MATMLFLDTEFNVIEVPEFLTVDSYDALMMRADYIYLDGLDDVNKMNNMRNIYETELTAADLFTRPGVWMWDSKFEHWVHVWDKICELRGVISRVSQTYLAQTKPVLSDCTED